MEIETAPFRYCVYFGFQYISIRLTGPIILGTAPLPVRGRDSPWQSLQSQPGFTEEEEAAASLKGKVPFELESTLKEMGVDYSQINPLFHSGFNVHIGDELGPDEREARERAAPYLVRSSVSLEKMI